MNGQRARATLAAIGFAVLTGFFCAPPAGAAEATTNAAQSDIYNDALARLLDPATPLEERRRLFSRYERLAKEGGYGSQYLVGSIYRLGEDAPAPIVTRDLGQARVYLGNAALNGYRMAMAKMAELELADGHPLDAMVWAQVFGHYSGATDPRTDKHKFGYLADLLHRISEKLDKTQMANVPAYVSQFVAQHDAQIRAADKDDAAGSTSGDNDLHRTFAPQAYETMDHRLLPTGMADYVVAYGPDGHAQAAWLMDALPTLKVGRELRPIAMQTRVNPTPAAKGLRYAFFPVTYDDGSYGIR